MSAAPQHPLEARIGRLLGGGTLAAVVLLALGSVVLLATGGSPTDTAPRFDLGNLVRDLISLQPAGLLWLGLVVVVVTPVLRVAAALVGYLGMRERDMAIIAALILVVIAAGVVAGIAGA